MAQVQERYTPEPIGVNASLSISSLALGGFLAKTAGTINFVTTSGRTIIDTFPVSAGVYYPLPFFTGTRGGTFTTAGGASGILGVA